MDGRRPSPIRGPFKTMISGHTHGDWWWCGRGTEQWQCPPVIGSSLPSHKIAAAGSALGPPPTIFRLEMAAPKATISHVIFDMDGLLLGNSHPPPSSSSIPFKPKIAFIFSPTSLNLIVRCWCLWLVSPCSCAFNSISIVVGLTNMGYNVISLLTLGELEFTFCSRPVLLLLYLLIVLNWILPIPLSFCLVLW